MLVYWLTYLVPALFTVGRIRVGPAGWFALGSALACVIGFRYEVGTDWYNYVHLYYERSANLAFSEAVNISDPAFVLLNWIATHIGVGIWFVNAFTGAVFAAGLVRFARRLPEPLLAFTAAIPYVGIVVAMNYTRQAIAIGFVLMALPYLYDRRMLAYLATIFVAALFHKSAIIFVPLVVLVAERHRFLMIVFAVLAGVAGYFAVLADSVNALTQQYVNSDYAQASQGAPLRIAMNALPALVLLLGQRRLMTNAVERQLWTLVALLSLVFMVLVFRYATAVDRVAVYFTPIQFVVASYLPQLIATNSRALARAIVVAVYAAVLYVWLTYAANSYAWTPYQFWPFLSYPGL